MSIMSATTSSPSPSSSHNNSPDGSIFVTPGTSQSNASPTNIIQATYPPELAPGSSGLLDAVNKLKFFLATAPGSFNQTPYDVNDVVAREERCLNRFQLPTGETVSCVHWNGLYHITGTDIVRALNFRFLAFGRPVKNVKKFEEGIFSDLRNLKSGTDATLEEPKSEFLELLFKYNCIRTQKKQKVFYWFSVPHDRLFLDALDRDLKREKLGVESTTEAVAEPALSFVYNPQKTLYEQFTKAAELEKENKAGSSGGSQIDGSGGSGDEVMSKPFSPPLRSKKERPTIITTAPPSLAEESDSLPTPSGESQVLLMPPRSGPGLTPVSATTSSSSCTSADERSVSPVDSACGSAANSAQAPKLARTFSNPQANSIFGAFSLFEGSPTYKQRRKPHTKRSVSSSKTKSASLKIKSEGWPHRSLSASGSPMPGDFPRERSVSTPIHSSPADQFHHQQGPMISHYATVGGYHHGQHGQVPPLDVHSTPMVTSPATYSAPSFTSVSNVNQVPVNFGPAAAAPLMTTPNAMAVGMKAYMCPLLTCGRLFKRLEHLKRHVRTHTLEKPYSCPKCDKSFARSDNLAAHVKTHDKVNVNPSPGPSEESPEDNVYDGVTDVENLVESHEDVDYAYVSENAEMKQSDHADMQIMANHMVSPPMSSNTAYNPQFRGTMDGMMTRHSMDHQYEWAHQQAAYVQPTALMTPTESEVERYENLVPAPVRNNNMDGSPSATSMGAIDPRGYHDGPERQGSMDYPGHLSVPRPSTAGGVAGGTTSGRRHRSETPTMGRHSLDRRQSYNAAAYPTPHSGYSPAIGSQPPHSAHVTPFHAQLEMVNALNAEISGSHELSGYPFSSAQTQENAPVEGLGFSNVDVNGDSFIHPRSHTMRQYEMMGQKTLTGNYEMGSGGSEGLTFATSQDGISL